MNEANGKPGKTAIDTALVEKSSKASSGTTQQTGKFRSTVTKDTKDTENGTKEDDSDMTSMIVIAVIVGVVILCCMCVGCGLVMGARAEREEPIVPERRRKPTLVKKLTRSLSTQLRMHKTKKTVEEKSPDRVLFQKSVIPAHAESGSKNHRGSQGSNSSKDAVRTVAPMKHQRKAKETMQE